MPPSEPPAYTPPPWQPPPGPIPNHLVWAIVATVFNLCGVCACLGVVGIITGIVAIVFAAKVNGQLAAGDFEGAARASNAAKILCWVTTGFAAAGILWIVYRFTLGGGMAGFNAAIEQYRSQLQR